MRIISADFNARTESGHVRLNFRGAREDLRDQGVQVGDWMWLSDSELVVGAQLAVDDRYGIVGVPRWNTLVHLDDDDSRDGWAAWNQFLQLSRKSGRDSGEEARIFQLLTILEANAPPPLRASLPPGYFALRRAGALHHLGEPALALVELEEAIRGEPDDTDSGALVVPRAALA